MNEENMLTSLMNEELREDCSCDWRYYKHYEIKGCTVSQINSCGCPVNYSCPEIKSTTPSKVCLYQNEEYKVGERIKITDKCQVCKCIDENAPHIVCRHRECPQLDRVEGENCHPVYEKNKCCPSRYECVEDEIQNGAESSDAVCIHDNVAYPLGAKIYSVEDPCLICECDENWNGINSSSCYQQECIFEKKKHLLEMGCIPVYHESDFCIFGESNYEIGAELSMNNSCVKCTCQVPPDFTCIHQSCRPPPNVENCDAFYVADKCCPDYDCLLADNSESDNTERDNSTSEEVVCPTPLCEDNSCQIGVLPGHQCPTCICVGVSREKNDFEPIERIQEHEYNKNNNETQNMIQEILLHHTTNNTDEKETLSSTFIEELSREKTENEGIQPRMLNPETALQTNENTFPGDTEYFVQDQSDGNVNSQAESNQSQQQWTVLQQSDDLDTSESSEIERESSEESSENYDELKVFGSREPSRQLDNMMELDESEFNNVIWVEEVPGCPSPLCENSSCRIGIPKGRRCPTCICVKKRQP
ncbi:VWFC domain-containing protein [Trichonephila inaurata madagascariensis]|uniref:VWFC domain-containing protein n=1 Tax=Trichonephila inaurata madagascariensis TaxID=2747483 RepID=A0A8X6X6K6_9ARAC|nr:VWFC domain-containing protein [Trichonephila inaurata madagascariensis]